MSNKILVYDGGKNIGVSGTVTGQIPTWNAATSAWAPQLPATFAGEYFVSTTGSDTTGNGSMSAPFATIQKAIDAAKLAYVDGVPVAINVAAGSYTAAVTIDRYNTFIQGAGARAAANQTTQLIGAITVDCVSTENAFNRQIGLAGCYVSTGTDVAAVAITGTGFFTVVVSDCYLTTGNAGSSANALVCSNANARTNITDCILTVQASTATAAIVNLTTGVHQVGNTRLMHGSQVTSGAASKALVVGGTATLFADRLLMETRTDGYQINVTGTWTSTTSAKLILSNSSLTNAAAGGLGLTTDISPAAGALAVLLFDDAFTVASGNVVHSAVGSIVLYCDLTFLGSSSTLAGITAVPITARTGAVQVDTLTLPNGTANRFAYTNASKVVTALDSGANKLVGYDSSGVPAVVSIGSGLSLVGNTLTNTGGGGGGGSGTVTDVTAGTGLLGGTITTSGTISADFGTTSGKIAEGNDSRFPPAPSAAGRLIYDTGTAWVALAAGDEGKVLTAHGAAAPTWETGGGGGSGTVTSITAGTGLTGGTITTSGTIALAALDPAPTGSYGGASTVGTFTVDAYGRVTAASNVSIAIAASAITSGTLGVARGGTGLATIPEHEVLIGAGTGAVTTVGLGDGELLIGSSTTGPAAATLTQGTGVTITNASHAITIAIGQAVGTGDSPSFTGLTLSGSTANRFLYANASKVVTALGDGASKLAGYDDTGSPAAITLGTGLSMTGSTLNVTAGGGAPYDLSLTIPGTPTASSECGWFVIARACTIEATGHQARCTNFPSGGNAQFTLTKYSGGSPTSIGTVTFNASSYTGTVSLTSGAVSLAAGDYLVVTAPANLYSIANVFLTLLAATA